MSRAAHLVLDASAWINILGTGCAEEILGALQGERLVVDLASAEVERHPLRATATSPLEPLVRSGLVVRRSLDSTALATFVSLVGAEPPDDLGDGEAATIALAHHSNFTAVLDERKARRVALERFTGLQLMSTVGIFRSDAVTGALRDRLPDAVYSALITARMRVLESDAAWVVDCIGLERARASPSMSRWIRKLAR